MIELHYRGLRIALASVESVQDRESGVMVNGLFLVDESYDEVMAKMNAVNVHRAARYYRDPLGGQVGDAEYWHVQGLAVTDLDEVTPDGHGGWRLTSPPNLSSGLRTRSQEEKAATPITVATPKRDNLADRVRVKMFMDPLSGDVDTLPQFLSVGYAREDLTEVIPDGQGGWTPVE